MSPAYKLSWDETPLCAAACRLFSDPAFQTLRLRKELTLAIADHASLHPLPEFGHQERHQLP